MKPEELEAMVELLQARQHLNEATDEAIERALRDHQPLEHAMAAVLPLLRDATGASGLLVHTYDENLERRDFGVGKPLADHVREGFVERERVSGLVPSDDGTRAYLPIDVAGEDFGFLVLSFDHALEDGRADRVFALARTWAEQVDNYLASIALARRKYIATTRLSDALKEPVLDVGLARALEIMRAEVRFDDLLLVFRHEDDVRGVSLRYKIVQNGVLTHDSRAPADQEIDEFIRTRAAAMLEGASRDLLEHFGMTRFREEVMILGVRDARIVGRLAVTSARGEFNTHDRELLERFADYLRQRIVDFNKEWKQLAQSFPPEIVDRLLAEEGYVEKRLRPVVKDVAILYADISGFSRVSEKVLCEPTRVGALIDTWGANVVDILWETGGVFDKMVGDCVIAFWGPPFHDMSPREACDRAIEAARRIRAYTRTLNDGREFPELAGVEPPIGVATGIHFAPLCVGIFGPDEDYTGFSSGMNNAARLQGVATRDEILCMDSVVTALGEPSRFADEQSAKVKNVAEPLLYRKLRDA